MTDPDRIFAQQDTEPGTFRFDERVVRVFPDMIRRSVPGYEDVLRGIGLLARRYAAPGSRIYDLGCSLGAATLVVRHSVQAEGVRIVAVDNAPAMIERCRELVANDNSVIPVDLQLADIMDVTIEQASVVVLNYTLQFLEPEQRLTLLQRIGAGMTPGGVLLLSEKLRFDDPATQQRMTDWHHDFKRAQGYSDLEIARKRTALEKVLQPETAKQHHRRLEQAGFEGITMWHQSLPFAAFAAFKPE